MGQDNPSDGSPRLPTLHRLSPELLWGSIAVLALLFLAALLAYAYPKTVITMGVQRSTLDENGQPRAGSAQAAMRRSLEASGIRLEFLTQPDARNEKPNLEWMLGEPRVDFTVASYTGAELPPGVAHSFRSFGAVTQTPLFFFARSGASLPHAMRELKGRKLVMWSSPEGQDKAYDGGSSATSVYSTDRVLQRLLARVGISPQNSTITNVWPQPVSLDQDWDVWISFGLPGRNSASHKMFEAIQDGRVQLIRLDDLEGVRRMLPELRRGTLAASTINSERGLPVTDIPYLAFMRTIVARENLDKGLEEPLAEAVLSAYSPQTQLVDQRIFPNFAGSDWFKPNATAEKFYRNGSSLWGGPMSPFTASYVAKLLVILLPLLAILWPLYKYGAELYKFYVFDLVSRRYSELELIEHRYEAAPDAAREALRARADEILRQLNQTRLPLFHHFFVQQMFAARRTAESVKKRLDERPPAGADQKPEGR